MHTQEQTRLPLTINVMEGNFFKTVRQRRGGYRYKDAIKVHDTLGPFPTQEDMTSLISFCLSVVCLYAFVHTHTRVFYAYVYMHQRAHTHPVRAWGYVYEVVHIGVRAFNAFIHTCIHICSPLCTDAGRWIKCSDSTKRTGRREARN